MDIATAEKVMGSINNWFETSLTSGRFKIDGGKLVGAEDFIAEGQYFRIVGSMFNDGLHLQPDDGLKDEEFEGNVWGLAIPSAFESVVSDIADYMVKEKKTTGPYVSESFGGYSYTKATWKRGAPATWKDVFRHELNQWRRLPGCSEI